MPNPPSTPDRFWHISLRLALLAYFIFAVALMRQKPGFHYDEAILVTGAVQMSRSTQELPINHHEHSWISVAGRSLPLMSLPYAGAVKDYLCLPLVALFGPRTVLFRLVSALLGAIGLWGFARLIHDQINARAGAAVALALAINPTYVGMNVFDNGTTSAWIAVLGLLSAAVSRYLSTPTTAAACAIGALIGFAIWTRANFLWIVGSFALATVIVLQRKLLLPARHYIAAALAAVAAGFPFLWYQAISNGGTWHSMSSFYSGESFAQRLYTRVVLFAEMLITDREHRAMWDAVELVGPWQRWPFLVVVLVSWAVCAIAGLRMRGLRIFSLAFLFLAAIHALSPLTIAEHHLMALLPFAVALVALACGVAAHSRAGRGAVAALAIAYTGCALYWQSAAIRGLHRTGGVGQWSDALIPLGEQLEEKYSGREIKLLDWGLANNLFVVTHGRLHLLEMFWGASREKSGLDRPWIEEVRDGGVFVVNGPRNRALPEASEAFLRALEQTHPVFRRTGVPQRNGALYAEVFDIEANSMQAGISSTVATGDPRFAHQLSGFHDIEQNQFRWTGRQFSINLSAPEGITQASFTMDLLVHELTIQKLGPITLALSVNKQPLEPQTYQRPGDYVFRREIKAGLLKTGANRFDFTLDKTLPPSSQDGRELGIVVTKASLVPSR